MYVKNNKKISTVKIYATTTNKNKEINYNYKSPYLNNLKIKIYTKLIK